MKPNHNGPKNGGGHWGKRSEAKRISRKLRRKEDHDRIMEAAREVMKKHHNLLKRLKD